MTKMWTQTSTAIKAMDKYSVAFFIDFTEAFNRIDQTLLVDELRRRYEAIRAVYQKMLEEEVQGYGSSL